MADKYVPTSWDVAFEEIGAKLRGLDPKSVVFYASGRASLEASYLYALFARTMIPLWYHDKASKTLASKGVPVRIRRGSLQRNGS